ncbi:histidine kinase [Amycolatopsis sp. NPDC051061]|uniref:sensor histidine kinase n=1 Tax=Amycolatopsis sp. NPDC051061 TaxID=3155042 RepID=UPI003413F054
MTAAEPARVSAMGRIRAVTRRYPTIVDALGVVVLYVISAADPAGDEPRTRTAAVLLLLAADLAVLAARRKWPKWTLALTALGTVPALLLGADLEPFLIPVAIATYTVTVRTDRWTPRALAAPVASLAVLVGVILAAGPGLTQEGLGRLAVTGLAIAVAVAVRNRRAYLAAFEERAVRAEQTREEEARRRVVEERLHIARELHDVVAHHIAVINVQASAAAQLVGSRPEAAAEALEHVRRSSRAVLDELRGLLGVLRRPEDAEEPSTQPMPGVAQLPSLIEAFRSSGLELRCTFAGATQPLPSTVDLVVYRVVQEALTNAHRYGSGTARLSLSYTATSLVLEVVNPPAAEPRMRGSGLGLVGMKERTAVVGGTLGTGLGPDGRFHVRAVLPIQWGENS